MFHKAIATGKTLLPVPRDADDFISFCTVAPQIFAAVGAGENSLLLSGFLGVCKVVACFFFLLFLVERVGRRWSLIGGSFLMGAYMLIVAILTVSFPPNAKAGLTSPAIASLTMIYLEAMTYNISWGPVPCTFFAAPFLILNYIFIAGLSCCC
jgi:hypothetical protein